MRRTLALTTLLLAGCVSPGTMRPSVERGAAEAEKQTQLALIYNDQVDAQARLDRIGYRLAVAAADLCGEHVSFRMGIDFTAESAVKEELRAAARQRYPQIADGVVVANVAANSPAQTAGVNEDDLIEALNGEALPKGSGSLQTFIDRYKKLKGGPVALSLRRNGELHVLTVNPVRACDYPFVVTADPAINASADGTSVFVNKGMMDFARSDDELALVVGHEMAHDFRGHLHAKRVNAITGQIVGGIFDVLIAGATGVNPGLSNLGAQAGAGAYSVEFEAEADYVGLYVDARAGYAIEDAPNFWRRMAVAAPKSVTMATDHPATPERFLALQAAVKEVEAKEQAHAALVPNEKGAVAATSSPQPAQTIPAAAIAP